MPLYNSQYLKELATSIKGKRLIFEAKESARTRNKLFRSSDKFESFDIFLSHSFDDKEIVHGLYLELTAKGYKVYVDWIIDSHLDRSNVTKSSAELIRRRMKSSKSLLLAISANAAMSKWMPWELGYVDGNTNRCAIIPVSEEASSYRSFNRVEYLKLYPYIEFF